MNPTTTLSFPAVVPFTLADGSLEFLAFIVFMLVATVYHLYTRRGSGIDQHPYGNIYGGAPGAFEHSEISGKDPRERNSWSFGTR